MKFEPIDSEIMYKGRAFTIRRDRVRTPDQREIGLDIVEHIGSVVVVPVDEHGNILFVRQYRHAAGEMVVELPAGTLEVGEPPEECASREIREETGKAAGKIEKIGSFYLAPGYSTELMHAYLCTELSHDPLEADADEFLDVIAMPALEAYRLAESGQLEDSKSLAALLLARKHILE